MRTLSLLIGLTVMSNAVQADLYVSSEKTPTSFPLWIEANNFYDGNRLHALCTSQNVADLSLCQGYIIGVTDIVQNQNANSICIPQNAMVGQIKDVVTKYLVEHPEKRHYSGYSEVMAALLAAFRCQSRPQ